MSGAMTQSKKQLQPVLGLVLGCLPKMCFALSQAGTRVVYD